MHQKVSQKQLDIFSGCTKRLKLLQFIILKQLRWSQFLVVYLSSVIEMKQNIIPI